MTATLKINRAGFMNIFIIQLISLLLITSATPPGPPAAGPGSLQYHHQSVIKHVYGEGDLEFWLFEPDNPKPAQAPLIIFLHGFGGTNPKDYGGWAQHL